MARLYARSVSLTAFSACLVVVLVPVLSAREPDPPPAITYAQTVKPVFDQRCGGCHMNGGHAGGLKLDTFELMMKGGEDGPVVALGDPGSSMLVKAIHYDDPSMQMPPKEKLSDHDILVIETWIKTTAKASSPAPNADPGPPSPAAALASTPPSVSSLPPTHASVAVSPTPSAPKPVASQAPTPPEHKPGTPAEAAPSFSLLTVSGPVPPKLAAEQEQFFETSIRPVLVGSCYSCHGSAAKGGLRLDSRRAVLQGGKDGPVVVPGHPESSMLTSAIHYADTRLQMPPRGSLTAQQIADFDAWIRMGLPWPATDTGPARTVVSAADRQFWSFRPPVRPAVPATKSAWVETDIDRFVWAKMDEKGLKANPDADKRTLLRRVTYDLTGLPPTPTEMSAFLADKSADAYKKVVYRLLASREYGDRWGRMWLDVVRYADTSGSDGDFPIPQAAKYRDYVIDAMNSDKPYDQFIREQIAGDLLPASTEQQHWNSVIATGYLANASVYDGAQAKDAVDNVGYAFLGTTMACARCHDHKYDPIPTSDYYAMVGIMKSTHFPNSGDDTTRLQQEFYVRDPKKMEAPEIKTYQAQMKPILNALYAVYKLPGTYDDLVPQLQRRRMDLQAHAPKMPEDAFAVSDMPHPVDAQVEVHGDPANRGDEVPRGTLQVLGGGPLPAPDKGSGRLDLANWIASADNPLTSRVIVNRLWQGHFGRGIVPTPNNFGTRGVAPSNQALLDYLATELVKKKWSLKALQYEIVTSHVYRLATSENEANDNIDPDNVYLWRHNRQRLDAEEIRDSLLADSQLLDHTPAGPHPFPPPNEWNFEQQMPFTPDLAKYDNNHRTVYMLVQRNVKNRYMTLFDGADGLTSTDQRSSSLTPLQALYFMNGDFPMHCSESFAGSLDKQEANDQRRIDQAYRTIYGRAPDRVEMTQSMRFVQQLTDKYVAGNVTPEAAHEKALSHLLLSMFSSNEFMFVE